MSLNWSGLLKWSMEFQDGTQDNNENRNLQPLSEERKLFLEKALGQFMTNVKDIHKACNEALDNIDVNNADASLASLKVISELLDEWPELARDFTKMRAHVKLLQAASVTLNSDSLVAVESLKVLANCLQNNHSFQDLVISENGLVKICRILKNNMPKKEESDTVEEIRKKIRYLAMTSLSCLVRSNKKAEEKFVREGGVAWVRCAIESGEDKYTLRSLILLFHLMTSGAVGWKDVVKVVKGVMSFVDKLEVDSPCDNGEFALDVIEMLYNYDEFKVHEDAESSKMTLKAWLGRLQAGKHLDHEHAVEIERLEKLINENN